MSSHPFDDLKVPIKKVVEDTAVELLRKASTKLPPDVLVALKSAYRRETSEMGRIQLGAILENIRLAEETKRPICQDTGLIIFYVTVGDGFGAFAFLPEALNEATRRATRVIPLRPNTVNPLTRHNPGDNTGRGIPSINYDVINGDCLELTALPKGAGSENMSALAMLTPSAGVKGIKKFVLDTIISAGGKPCPPTVIGVGIGGGADVAMKLAKKALLRPLNECHPEKEVAQLERELLKMVNSTGIGPMGLGGKYTALGLNVECAYCHTASLPVGVNVQCWANRRATARIHKDGQVEYLW
ncbi:MAG: fumarate hydratase [Candidatus Bathyarchaeota archaeon]